MAEAALKPMTVEEFLSWPGDGDTRYQLRDGRPVAMAPPGAAHRVLVGNLVADVGGGLRGRAPCTVQVEVGIRSPSNARSFHQADIAVTCEAVQAGDQDMERPLLIFEVLSPGTAGDDRRIKLLDYRMLPSVQEIVLVDSQVLYCEVHRRLDGDRWLTELLRDPDSRLQLTTVGLDVSLGDVYRNVPLAA